MRDRRKKHLTERLAACGRVLFSPVYDDPNFETSVEKPEYLDLRGYFGNDNPMMLEIGCGKGAFILEMAKRRPDVNFIAVEKVGNVLVMACEKILAENLTNVLFLRIDAHMLPKYIPPHTVSRIYLNFSCPYPKNRDINKRLTYDAFLKIYDGLLTADGEIHQKTDNMHFFEYSLAQYPRNGWLLQNISLDLHKSDFPDNIVTEYEARFSQFGPIYRLEAYRGHDG